MADLVNEVVPLTVLSHSLKGGPSTTKLTEAGRKT